MHAWIIASTGIVMLAGTAAAQIGCAPVGANRWTVKTTAPTPSIAPHAFDARDFARLPAPPGVERKSIRQLDERYGTRIVGTLREGDPVSVSGWVQFIKTSADDCDYHIQITPTRGGRNGTIIVEIPEPDARHVGDPALRTRLATARQALRQQLHLNGDPPRHGVVLTSPVYMEFTGALFFDANDYPACDRRGHGTPAATCWEVHPVTSSRVADPPPR